MKHVNIGGKALAAGMVVALSIASGAALLTGGCASSTDSSQAATTQERQYQEVGSKQDGSYDILVTNGLGLDVTSVSIKLSTDADFPESILTDGASFVASDTVRVYYTPATNDDTLTYDVSLTESDGTVVQLYALPLSKISEMEIKFEDGVGFITYKDTDGNEQSTKDAALAKQQADAEAEAQAEAEAEEEAQAEAEAEEEAAAKSKSSGSSSSKSSSSSSSSSGSSSSSAPSQSEDSCGAGSVVLRN